MSRMNTIDMQTTEWGVMDYRRNDISVEQFPTEFVVTLTFDFMNTNESIKVKNTKKVASAWCQSHTAEAVITDFRYMMDITSTKWIGPNVIEITIPIKKEYSIESIVEDFKTNSLEDGSYEGMPGESFWVVPCSFASKF